MTEALAQDVYLTDTDPSGYRPGDKALIVGVKFLNRFGKNILCYELRFMDESLGYIPVGKKSCELTTQYSLFGL